MEIVINNLSKRYGKKKLFLIYYFLFLLECMGFSDETEQEKRA